MRQIISSWTTQFTMRLRQVLIMWYLRTVNKASVAVTNVSMGGNTSYAGYVRTMDLDDSPDYDLAIICYGQNDGSDSFSTYYESTIQAIKSKYPDCSIISILESFLLGERRSIIVQL